MFFIYVFLTDLITLATPPPSNTPESSKRSAVLSKVGSWGCCIAFITMGVESGLGGVFRTTSDILGDGGTKRSGEDVLVSATDSPRSGQRHCLEAKFADGRLLYSFASSTNESEASWELKRAYSMKGRNIWWRLLEYYSSFSHLFFSELSNQLFFKCLWKF